MSKPRNVSRSSSPSIKRPPTPDRDYEGGPFVRRISNNVGAPLIQTGLRAGPVGAKSVMDMIGNTGEAKATPIRNPSHAFFNINSIDRYASAENPISQFALITQTPAILNSIPASNYQMSLQRNLLTGYFHRLTVTDVNLQWNIPTINSQNYIFNMTTINGQGISTTHNVVLTQDYYTFTELATQLQTAIRAAFSALSSLTVVWGDTANGSGYKYVIATNVSSTIYFNTTLSETTGILSGQSIQEATRAMFKLYNMIGVTTINVGLDEANTTISLTPTFPTLIYTSYVDIISNKLSQFMRVKDSETAWAADTSVITRIYLTNQGTITAPAIVQQGITAPVVSEVFQTFAIGSRPFILNYTPTTPKNIAWSQGQSVIDFDIRVVDEFGDIVPWNVIREIGGGVYFVEFFEFQLTILASET